MDANAAMKYRPDIDGLRAIAVLAVLFFHLGIAHFRGGFIGVDMFFVISGFLITRIIQRDIEDKSFSYLSFYERRIRRIFPALIVVIVFVIAIGLIVFLPSDLKRLGNNTLATLLFISNILFWREAGYFSTSSELNPLLHTWTLSVEEQFYIGLPVLLMLVNRYAARHLKLFMITAGIISFVACVWIQPIRPKATFFLSPFRGWEFVIGALPAIGAVPSFKSKWHREIIGAIALITLLASFVMIKPDSSFPGWEAAFPVFATAVLLNIGTSGGAYVSRILSIKPLVFIGLISYSLYLWHWPVLVFSKYINGLEPLGMFKWAVAVASIIAGWLSYRYVESPFRKGKKTKVFIESRYVPFAKAAAAMAVLVAFAFVIRSDEGLSGRFPPAVLALDEARYPIIPYRTCDGLIPGRPREGACTIGARGSAKRVLIWGDSFALAWSPALDDLLQRKGYEGILALHSGCPPLFDVENPGFSCLRFSKGVARWLTSNKVEGIFLIASWVSYSKPTGDYTLEDVDGRRGNAIVFPVSFQRTMRALGKTNSNVIVIGPTPAAPNDLMTRLAIAEQWNRPLPRAIMLQDFKKDVKYFWQERSRVIGYSNIRFVDPSLWLCSKSCRYIDGSGRPLYRDGGHLSVFGAMSLEGSLRRSLSKPPASL